ncbi:ATP-dependent Clp protease proteolytic subunit [Stieleria sp. JC731]|uniref:NfeD family protein n=1 Tax=Pirellulaceae TaxID=2691357 RepID=UPI001E5B8C45|nr:ATP-dependent Clp protease proteolytic subunit [Stieleria sp. JC731]MCC9599376.1 ATP-dependent Clp protease proteolytic subunit [Stieleria sp. JC731]
MFRTPLLLQRICPAAMLWLFACSAYLRMLLGAYLRTLLGVFWGMVLGVMLLTPVATAQELSAQEKSAEALSSEAEGVVEQPRGLQDEEASGGGNERQQDTEVKAAKVRKAVLIPFHDAIHALSAELLMRKFHEAVDSGVDVIILDINSPGGEVFYTFEIMDMILETKNVETVAYVQKDAISGAALIAISCDKIYMSPNGRLGDAGVIMMGEDGAFRYVEEKRRSAVAQRARDAAEQTGRPMTLAEKMTDKDMVVFRSVNKESGEVRYLSDKELESMPDADQWEVGKPIREANKDMFFIANGKRLVELGMAEQTVESVDELAEQLDVETPIPVLDRTGTDIAIMILNHWFVTFLLLVVGLVALGIELSAPGIGIGGLTSMLCFGLFFWSRFLGGTAGWLEVTLFVLGIAFIGMEIFVIPGFGVAGLGGFALLLTSLVMASHRFIDLQNGQNLIDVGWDVVTVLGAFIGFFIAMLILSKYIGDIPGLGRLTLKPQVALPGVGEDPAAGGAAPSVLMPGWQRVQIGDTGVAVGALRPGGKMAVDDYTVDVVTEGDFVDGGQSVKVIAKQGSRVVVRLT